MFSINWLDYFSSLNTGVKAYIGYSSVFFYKSTFLFPIIDSYKTLPLCPENWTLCELLQCICWEWTLVHLQAPERWSYRQFWNSDDCLHLHLWHLTLPPVNLEIKVEVENGRNSIRISTRHQKKELLAILLSSLSFPWICISITFHHTNDFKNGGSLLP